ncbi:Patatin-like phospholipase domain [Dillenia turbinata]|uniref:Patatin n=1 Tax=Dillenia turbinata TaxID=194707 RepID=A0AAN8UBM9_9MAGN
MEWSKITMELYSKLEHQWLFNSDEEKKTRILSIDGGGTNAAIAGACLVHLEDQIKSKTINPNSKITDFFDLISGTGIGGILATMLVADDGNGNPLLSAKQAVDLVTKNQSELSKLKKFKILNRRPKYSCTSMEKMLRQALSRQDGKLLTLKDTCKPLLVPCYDLHSSGPFVFSKADAMDTPSFNFELWKICRATTATPGRFRPFELTSVDGKTKCLAIDGGVVMNNPTAVAITHVLHNKRDFPLVNGVEDLLVLSIGNGMQRMSPLKRRNEERMTASVVVDIAADGVSETVDQMVGNAFWWNRSDYVRIQGSVEEDILAETGVESLPMWGKRVLTESNASRIERFVHKLVNKTSLPPPPHKNSDVTPLHAGP